jgi:hypothetical protein
MLQKLEKSTLSRYLTWAGKYQARHTFWQFIKSLEWKSLNIINNTSSGMSRAVVIYSKL